jgi:hypothetical protein
VASFEWTAPDQAAVAIDEESESEDITDPSTDPDTSFGLLESEKGRVESGVARVGA